MNETVFGKNSSSPVPVAVTVREPLSVAIQAAYISIGVSGLFGNLLCLVVLLGHAPLLRKSANYFIANQSFIDLLVSIILIPTVTVDVNRLRGTLACYAWRSRTIFLGLFTASLFNITALTIERYFKIVHPVQHRIWMTKKRILWIVVGVSVAGIVLKIPYAIGGTSINQHGICIVQAYSTGTIALVVGIYNSLVEYFLPLLIIAFCYIQMARSLRQSIRPVTVATPRETVMGRARRNIIKTLLIVVVIFISCTTYKQILVLMKSFSGVNLDVVGSVFNSAQIMSYMVCCTNPFIYVFNYEEFQVGLRKVVLRRKQTQPLTGQTVFTVPGTREGNEETF